MATTLAARLLAIRQAAGYGGPRQAAEFARRVGIKPASLHNLESGKTNSIGKSLAGYLSVGASLDYIEKGKGEPMIHKQIEQQLEFQRLISMLGEVSDDERAMVGDVLKNIIRRKKGGSANDPFKTDPPKDDNTQ